MSGYTIFQLKEIQEIASRYVLGDVIAQRILSGGSENSNYYLETSKGAYVLTLCETKTATETQNLVSLLLHLKACNFYTSELVSLPDGKYISEYKNKPILIKKYINGRIQSTFSKEEFFKIGSSIAELHNLPLLDYLPKWPAYGAETFDQTDLPEGFFKEWLEDVQKIIKPCFDPKLPTSMIHADVFDNNIILTEEGPVIMDFEEVCNYYRAFDIGMAIVGTCTSFEKVDVVKSRQLISGYQSINKLTELEMNRLTLFITYAAAAMGFWRFKQFNIHIPDSDKNNSYLELVHIADDAKSIPPEELFIH